MKRLFITLGILFTASMLWSQGVDTYRAASELFGVDPDAGQNSFLSLLIPGGGKFEGMATAHTAVALDGGYLESNPAAGSFLPRTLLTLSHLDWIGDSAVETVTFTMRPERSEDLGLGFSTRLLHIPFTGYNPWGSQYNSGGSSAVGWYTELSATSSASYNFLRNFYFGGISVGGSLKMGFRGVSTALAPNQNALALMGDFGILTSFNFLKPFASRDMNFAVGATVKNMGAEFIDTPDPLPTFAGFGFSYKPLRPLIIAADVNVPFNLNGESSESFNVAVGANADITSFLSAHTGILIKAGKPRFSIGAQVSLENMTLTANYTLDLAGRLEAFDRMSVSIQVDLDTVKQLLIRDNVQTLYLEGLSAYAEGDMETALRYWENCLSLDPTFKPAREMIQTASETRRLQEDLRESLIDD